MTKNHFPGLDVKAYIASGILELYVLGKLSSEEEADVLAVAAEYPEVKAELEQIEIDLERFDHLNRVAPPSGILSAILGRIRGLSNTAGSAGSISTSSAMNWLPWAGFGIATLLAILFLTRYLKTEGQVEELETEIERLRNDCDEKDVINTSLLAQLNAYRQPGTRLVDLAGSDLSPESEAQVLFNPNENVAYLAVANLPPPPAGKDYQLWALVDGQPVDLGIFDPAAVVAGLIEVDFPVGTGAFAVTLEDEGGRPTPNLEQLYLIGNVG
ncbi:hypothetical protein CEQ90_03625 [Lewinellaceae bacterium SD302]|nr:hypothetical protein CEQ90_03625 [Lewinellaceae bacterium SD302]